MAREKESENIIEVADLRKEFNGLVAVNDVSFNVRRGAIFAFLGPNGAGKTTTIKMLTTLLHPTSGTIRINSFDPISHPADVRRSFGIVFQDPSLDEELTAYENMELHGILYGVPKEIRTKRITELLGIVELWDRRKDLVKHFSGGMKRRLEIARGLLHHPKILFLDEPTIGLDPQTRNHMWGHVKSLNEKEGVTVFLTTHYMEEAEKVAEWIAIIDQGKIVAKGTPQDLKEKAGKESLEDAFIALTGHALREESSRPIDTMRIGKRLWSRR